MRLPTLERSQNSSRHITSFPCVDNTFAIRIYSGLSNWHRRRRSQRAKYLNGPQRYARRNGVTNNTGDCRKTPLLSKSRRRIMMPVRCMALFARNENAGGPNEAALRKRDDYRRVAVSTEKNRKGKLSWLRSHPQYALARRQMSAFGGMISLMLKPEQRQTISKNESVSVLSQKPRRRRDAHFSSCYNDTCFSFQNWIGLKKRSYRWIGPDLCRHRRRGRFDR